MKLMKQLQFFLAPVVIAGAIVLATALPQAKAHLVSNGSYPAVVCPGVLGGGSQLISLPTSRLPIRQVYGKSQNFRKSKSNVLSSNSYGTVVGGNSGSEIVFNAVTGGSTADTVCTVGGFDEWFVGGSAGVTSQGILDIVNSGLSDSTVQVFLYTSKVVLAPVTYVVKANSDKKISLASLAPGEESIALHVLTISGRVTSFMLDHRNQGLHDLGASFVPPATTPQTQLYVGGLLTSSSTSSAATLRFLVPGNVDANLHVTIYSNNGSFTPVGFDLLKVAHQKVIDVPLPVLHISGPYGLLITADQPAFASALMIGKGDFAWAGELTPISKFQLNLAGTSASFIFIGANIDVRAQWHGASGKGQQATIVGQDSAVWAPKGPIYGLLLTPINKVPVYGGAVVTNSAGGLNSLPLLANQIISGSQLPIADVRTLTHSTTGN